MALVVSGNQDGSLPGPLFDRAKFRPEMDPGNLNDLRAILGNDVAIQAYREGKLPFPDGAIIARLAWNYVPSEENNKVFGRPQSFVTGDPTNVQFLIKDSKKYVSTGGWGFAQFNNGSLLTTWSRTPALLATSLAKRTILFSPATHLSTGNPLNGLAACSGKNPKLFQLVQAFLPLR